MCVYVYVGAAVAAAHSSSDPADPPRERQSSAARGTANAGTA